MESVGMRRATVFAVSGVSRKTWLRRENKVVKVARRKLIEEGRIPRKRETNTWLPSVGADWRSETSSYPEHFDACHQLVCYYNFMS